MATEENAEPQTLSLVDRITERVSDDEEMEIDEETKRDRRQALLDGPLEDPSSRRDTRVADVNEGEEEYSKGLLNRIAKNRLYTVDETAPDAPDTRVPTHVSRPSPCGSATDLFSIGPRRSQPGVFG